MRRIGIGQADVLSRVDKVLERFSSTMCLSQPHPAPVSGITNGASLTSPSDSMSRHYLSIRAGLMLWSICAEHVGFFEILPLHFSVFPEMAKVGKMRGRRLGGQKAGGGLGHRRKPFTILPPWWSWIIMLGWRSCRKENRMALYISVAASKHNILIYRVSGSHILTSQSRYYIREVDFTFWCFPVE